MLLTGRGELGHDSAYARAGHEIVGPESHLQHVPRKHTEADNGGLAARLVPPPLGRQEEEEELVLLVCRIHANHTTIPVRAARCPSLGEEPARTNAMTDQPVCVPNLVP